MLQSTAQCVCRTYEVPISLITKVLKSPPLPHCLTSSTPYRPPLRRMQRMQRTFALHVASNDGSGILHCVVVHIPAERLGTRSHFPSGGANVGRPSSRGDFGSIRFAFPTPSLPSPYTLAFGILFRPMSHRSYVEYLIHEYKRHLHCSLRMSAWVRFWGK